MTVSRRIRVLILGVGAIFRLQPLAAEGAKATATATPSHPAAHPTFLTK